MPKVARVVLVAMILFGCDSVATLSQRCAAGDAASCERACAKGVAGEGGCFSAGNALRQRAGGDYASANWTKAREYFGKSCRANHADGCLVDAEMLAAPFSDLSKNVSQSKAISDAGLVEYDGLLTRACDLNLPEGCKRLGDALIGKKPDRAKASYEKACASSKDVGGCRTARDSEVDTAERWRLACTRRVADACDRLGGLLLMVDPARAVRLFQAAYELRGVSDLVTIEAFVQERVRGVREQGVPLEGSLPEPSELFDVLPVVKAVRGDVALVEMEGALRRYAPHLAACLPDGGAKVAGAFPAHLIVDRTGDVYRAVPGDSTLPNAATPCLIRALESVVVSPPPSGRADLDVVVEVKPREVAARGGGQTRKVAAEPSR